ncbi:helix-turn-helix domain-containing protein [Actinomycetospora atypica]|uniref:Helix-turn-helix domain-containing protein n=1 Tax=Actinomycetospora atypica TaxID=1290095 RepID=A0ABV9YQW0_9PSEU
MSEDEPPVENHSARPLDALIRAAMKERGWTYSDLERASGRALTRARWQQLGSGVVQRKFPDPSSLSVISEVLEVDITTVVLAAARSVGLDVRTRGTDLAHLLPALTERLSGRMRDAILTLVRAAVADARTEDAGDPGPSDALSGLRLEWPKSDSPSGSERGRPDSPGT